MSRKKKNVKKRTRRLAGTPHLRLDRKLSKAGALLEQGNLEEAHELMWPIFQKKRFHSSEIATVCGTMAQILALEGKLEGARHWITLLKRLDPGNPGIPRMEAMLPR